MMEFYGVKNKVTIKSFQQAGSHKINSPCCCSVELQKKLAQGGQGDSDPRSCYQCNATIHPFEYRSVKKPSLSSMPQITPEGVSM